MLGSMTGPEPRLRGYVLGPLELRLGDPAAPIVPAPGRPSRLLASLLLALGRVVAPPPADR
jgi:hypothetical protein